MSEIADTDGSVESAAAMLRGQIDKKRAEIAAPEQDKTDETPPPALAEAGESEIPPGREADEADETEDQVDDTGAGDAPATIEPPSNWSQADRDWFKSLDPVRQDFVLRHQKGTQAAEARRQNEYRAAMEQLAKQAAETAQERERFNAAAAQQFAQFEEPIIRDFKRDFSDVLSGKIDPIKLAESDPARFAKFQAYQAKFQQIATTRQAMAAKQEQERQHMFSEFVRTENDKLLAAMPELNEPEKRERWNRDVADYLVKRGYSPTRIELASANDLVTAYKAMLWDKAQAARNAPRPAAANGKEHQREAPKVMKSGSGASAGGGSEKIAALETRARKTGSIDDVAALMRAKMARTSARA